MGIRKSGTPRKGAHAKRMLCQKFGEREREREGERERGRESRTPTKHEAIHRFCDTFRPFLGSEVANFEPVIYLTGSKLALWEPKKA